MISDTDTLVERIDAPCARFALADEMFVERGTIDDWNLLHNLHYKAESLPIGPRFWRLDLRGNTVGVLVTGTPRGMLRERHIVFPNIKPGAGETRLTNTNRYNYINANFRVISRFVIDTMYRGIGAGYKMMNLVSRMEGNTFMEIQSSMSKFNSFGQKAGFRFVRPTNANGYDKVMKLFRLNFAASPQDHEAIIAEIESRTEAERKKIRDICRTFYFKHSARENTTMNGAGMERRMESLSDREIIKGIQAIGLGSPMYGVWKCPDPKGTVPAKLPLLAFDAQGTNERLKWHAEE